MKSKAFQFLASLKIDFSLSSEITPMMENVVTKTAAPSTECGTNPQVQVVPPVPAIRLVDAQIQTEVDSPVLDRPCNCGPKTRVKIERR